VNTISLLKHGRRDGRGGVLRAESTRAYHGDPGDRVLLRISNLSTTDFFTLTSLGIPMRVVGRGARLLRGPDGKDLSHLTSSVTLGGGEAMDVILDTTGVVPGTYFLYTTNLNF